MRINVPGFDCFRMSPGGESARTSERSRRHEPHAGQSDL